MYSRYMKRPLDIVCALLALIIFSWLYILIAVLVRILLGGPVLFKQQRPGKDGKIFTIYKFRTMTNARDSSGDLLPNESRTTSFGNFLRRSSLDELPEVFNILKGDMSVVGPRPLLVRYLNRYSEEQMHRHDVRPGLTGLAQINGRNSISWEEKFMWDLKYVHNVTFLGDLKIIFLTVWKAFFVHDDIGDDFVEDFMGNQSDKTPPVSM